ncbi:MAG: metallochaperone AztD [Rhizobiaceae bacterium]|nr:metallochaperone AztD [Rhizobiaceae bacterium]
MLRPATILLASAAVMATASAWAQDRSAVHLFVADHTDAVVHAIDAGTAKVLARFETASPATLYATESGRTVFAVQRDGNRVTAFSSGIELDDHGDHGDIEIETPKALGLEIAGERPVHLVEHHGDVALFFDGEGVARIVREGDVLEGRAQVREVATQAPHHGVAISYGDHVVVSWPNRTDPTKNPDGVRVVDAAGAQVGADVDCPNLHGEASSGNLLAIACQTGLLLVEAKGGEPEITHLPYAAGLPRDTKVSTLLAGKGLQYFLGNFGASAVVLIDPQDEEAFRLVELPMRRVHFAVDPVRVKFAYVFTEDGQLHRLNVLSGRISDSLALTQPYSMDGHWSEPRARVAVGGDEIFVTDPLAGKIHVVDAATFTKVREIAVPGKPFNIAAVAGSGETHD